MFERELSLTDTEGGMRESVSRLSVCSNHKAPSCWQEGGNYGNVPYEGGRYLEIKKK